jgi:hypothetical protein
MAETQFDRFVDIAEEDVGAGELKRQQRGIAGRM